MAGLRSLVTKETPNGQQARKLCASIQDKFPFVAEVLGGLEANGSEKEISPGTITVFIHEGKARFSINVKDAQKTFIGEVADIANPWGSIDSALSMGDVSSKRYTERSDRYTESDKKLLL